MKPQTNYKLDVDTIVEKLTLDQNALKLNQIKIINDLPFITSTAKTDAKEICSIEAEVFRSVLGINKSKLTNTNEVLNEIIEQVKTEDSGLLEYMLNTLYVKEGTFKKFHPRMYTFCGSETSGIKNLSKYIINVLMSFETVCALDEVMKSSPNSVIEELILDVIPYEKDEQKKIPENKNVILRDIQDIFTQDFKFLCTNQSLFINNIDKLFSYYLFFCISQVILQLREGFEAHVEIIPVYYFLDWEKASKSRISYKQGWKMIQKKSENIFAYTNLLQILNCTVNEDGIGSFQQVYKRLESMTEKELCIFEEDMKNINNQIMNVLKIETHNSKHKKIFGQYEYIDMLLQTLIESKKVTGRKAAFERYEKRVKDVADVGFLKPRGQLGSTLNFKPDWIIFLTRICIGQKEKIRLNELWQEFEKRAVYFDKLSREKIVEYFEKINILEKKSDSGDAQYVRVL